MARPLRIDHADGYYHEQFVAWAREAIADHFGMNIHWADATDTILASPGDRNLALAGIEGEATLAVVRRDQDGELLWWAAADAWALSIDGRAVLPRHGESGVLVEGSKQ